MSMVDNAPLGGTKQAQLCTVSLNGVSLGVYDTWTGGDPSAAVPQHRSGGQRTMQSYRALPKFSMMTVGRIAQTQRDWELIRSLVATAGQVPMSVTLQPLDADGNAYGNSRTASGMFAGQKGLDGDSDSDALQPYSLDMTVDQWQ